MAHFAKLDENNIVSAVHIVSNEVIMVDGNESEQAGIDFLTNLYGHTNWKQTSYNGSMRRRYAGVDFKYDENLDAFIPPKPYPSWVFDDENIDWKAPSVKPEGNFAWDEESLSWKLFDNGQA
jgi:hypothetical protein